MKLTVLILLLGLAGCASRPAMTDVQMEKYQLTNADCPQMDSIINNLENSLKSRGLLYANPEELGERDRMYNAYARNKIWSLRIGCNNPTRYTK
jgi:hypothetical protein